MRGFAGIEQNGNPGGIELINGSMPEQVSTRLSALKVLVVGVALIPRAPDSYRGRALLFQAFSLSCLKGNYLKGIYVSLFQSFGEYGWA